MKKITAILCAALIAAGFSGCKGNGEISNSSGPVSVPGSDGSGNSDSSDNSGGSENSVPEKKKPEGEPTFLIGLDGEPVYTGDISQIQVYNADSEKITADTFDRENIANVVCEGFTYAYIPRPAVNFMERPELFEKRESNGDIFYDYIGAELPDNCEFLRVNVGDKIGGLTVKAAKAFFEPIGYDGMNEIGEFYDKGYVEYEGEVELTGYVTVTEEAPLYPGNGGNIFFYPDAKSSVKIPQISVDRNYENEFKVRHNVSNSFYGWYGDNSCLSLGNIADIDSDLREGDKYVKVKVTVGDIVLGGRVNGVIKDIELL